MDSSAPFQVVKVFKRQGEDTSNFDSTPNKKHSIQQDYDTITIISNDKQQKQLINSNLPGYRSILPASTVPQHQIAGSGILTRMPTNAQLDVSVKALEGKFENAMQSIEQKITATLSNAVDQFRNELMDKALKDFKQELVDKGISCGITERNRTPH